LPGGSRGLGDVYKRQGFKTQNPPKAAPKSSNESVKKDADYIDFEELK
jgi:hypothetical protein